MSKISGEYIKGLLRGHDGKILFDPHISSVRGTGVLKFFFSHRLLSGTCSSKISVP